MSIESAMPLKPSLAAEKIMATWTGENWLWTAHSTTHHCQLPLRAARRALNRLVREGKLIVYGRNLSAGKTLYAHASIKPYHPSGTP